MIQSLRLLRSAASGILFTSVAHAATVTWDTAPGTVGTGNGTVTGGTGAWNTTSGNWTVDAGANNLAWDNVANASDIAVFGGTGGTVTLGSTINAGGVTFSITGYTLAGSSALNFGSGLGVINSSAVGAASGLATLSAVLDGTGGATLAANGDLAYNGNSSSARLDITGSNTLSGGLTITSGLVRFGGQSSAGSNAITLNGGGLVAVNTGAGGGNLSLNNAVSIGASGGTLRSWGATTLAITGPVTGAGTLFVTDTGTVSIANFGSTGAVQVGTGILEFTQGSLTLTQSLTNMTGTTAGVVKLSGGGTYTLSNTANKVNFNVVSGGTLNFAYADGTGYRTVTLDATSSAFRTNSSATSGYGITYVVTGNGTAATTGIKMLSGGNNLALVAVNGAATTLRVSGATTATWYGWDTNAVHLSTVAAASGTVVDPLINLNAGTYGFVMNAAAGANTATGDIVINGALTGALNVNNNRFWINKTTSNTGSVLLNGTGTTTSFVQIDAGTLLVGNNAALGTGTLVAGGNATVASYGAARSLTNKVFISDNKTLTVNTDAGDTTLSGVVSGVASNAAVAGTGNALTKTGLNSLILKGANIYAGTTTVSAGTVVTGNASALGTGSVSVAGGAVLQVGDGTTNTVTLGSAATLALAAGSSLKLGSAASQIASTAAFTLGNGVKIDISGLNLSSGVYTLISGSSGSSSLGTWNSATDLVGGVSGSTYSLAISGTNLVLTAVPEPSVYGLAGAGVLAAVSVLRRRRKAI